MQAYCGIWAGFVGGKLYIHDEILYAESEEAAHKKFLENVSKAVGGREDKQLSLTRIRNVTAVLRMMKHEDQSPQLESGSAGLLSTV